MNYQDSYEERQARKLADTIKKVKQYAIYGGIGIAAIFALIAVLNTFMWVDAGEIVVIQSPTTGALTVITEPGPTCQCWGTVTTYPRRQQLAFAATDKSAIQVRFNDGGHAAVSGQISWEMPLDPVAVIKLHKEFRSVESIDRQLIQPSVIKAFYQTSPLMSSTESYASRRTEFLELFQDQLRLGLYKTRTIAVKEPDPVTGEEKTVAKVEIEMGPGGPLRSEASAFSVYGIGIPLATITAIDYDTEVEKQIQQQRDAILAVQTAQAASKRAEQDALTAKANGEAMSAKARAEQEAIKATEVTQAEKTRDVALITAQQRRDVAKLAQEAAAFTKAEQTLLGEGEAARKRLVMEADGALAQKLDTYMKTQAVWADAFSKYGGQVVPSVVMGGGAQGGATNGVNQMMEVLALKAAKDLSLDLNTTAKGR